MTDVPKRLTLVTNGYPLHEIGVKSLVGYMEAQGVPCRTLYLNHATVLTAAQRQQLVELCEGSLLVGFSLMSKDARTFRPVTAEVKGRGMPVVWGGIHATAMPEDSLRDCDFACVGEGELSLHRLYASLQEGKKDYSEIPNLAYAAEGRTVLPRVSHSEGSLDALPYPDYEFRDAYLLRADGQFRKIPASLEERRRFFAGWGWLFYSQRGCPFSCTYCSNSLYHAIAKKTGARWYRTTSPARVKEEIRHHLKFVPVGDMLHINDDDFLTRPAGELEEIGAFIKNELGLRFNINATPTAVTREKVALLAKYGLRQIALGVQTGAARILQDIYRRPIQPERVLKAAHIINEFHKEGVVVDYGFILENPYEGPEEHRESLRLFLALPRPFTVSLYSLAFFPGTELTRRALAEQVITRDDVALDKDYRESIRPSFVHMLFEANYCLNIPDEINEILLSDNVLVSERKKYARMLLGNYFISDAVRRMVGLNANGSEPASGKGANAELVDFLSVVAEILKNWCEPTKVLEPAGGAEDLILQYAARAGVANGQAVEIGFNKGQIVRLGDMPVSATAPANALNASYRKCGPCFRAGTGG